ncbi:MAG: hypothetical protein LBI82_12510 [Dysgonamonadaceae bacterium]|jgi:hypothetical protein|nr:hypothetical protein [Dysgonamonadaceae bacterium]
MKTEEIKQLLEDFYNGETCVEQEQLLLHYFESESILEELQKEKEIFLQFYQDNSLPEHSHLETKLSELIGTLANEETAKVDVSKRQIWLWAGSVAASFLLLVSFGLLFHHNNDKEAFASQHTQYKDTFDNPEGAAIEAQKALALFSANYNKGIDQLAMAVGNIEKTNEIINKTFK